MVRLIKNVPRNAASAIGNRGVDFPLSPVNCFFKIPPPECFLVLEESRNVSLLQETRKKVGIYCPPPSPSECYIAMQEDGRTILELPDVTETNYASVSCLE